MHPVKSQSTSEPSQNQKMIASARKRGSNRRHQSHQVAVLHLLHPKVHQAASRAMFINSQAVPCQLKQAMIVSKIHRIQEQSWINPQSANRKWTQSQLSQSQSRKSKKKAILKWSRNRKSKFRNQCPNPTKSQQNSQPRNRRTKKTACLISLLTMDTRRISLIKAIRKRRMPVWKGHRAAIFACRMSMGLASVN